MRLYQEVDEEREAKFELTKLKCMINFESRLSANSQVVKPKKIFSSDLI